MHLSRLVCALAMSSTGAMRFSAKHVFQRVWPGKWQLSRRIVSPGQADVFVEGYGSFVDGEGGGEGEGGGKQGVLQYSEVVAIAGAGEGTQRYEYRWDATNSPDVITKYFHDGRLFYRLATNVDGQLRAEEHLCVADLYVPEYEFESETAFRLTYAVCGPAKNYKIVTQFTKTANTSTAAVPLELLLDDKAER